MGVYNEVVADVPCPRCGRVSSRTVQYKFGHCRLIRYTVGDTIAWDNPRHDYGEKGLASVVVSGFPDRCPNCDDAPDSFEIWFEYDRIIKVCPDSGCYDFPNNLDIVLIKR